MIMSLIFPTIAAIETSTELASVALLCGDRVTSRESSGAKTHSMTVLALLQELLREQDLTLGQCEALAFGAGPGSFTGVRTACGLAQGLAFGANLPVVPVVTLLAMADAARNQGAGDNIITVLDARMGEVYWAQYRFDEQWQIVKEPCLSAPEQVIAEDASCVAGNGLAAYTDRFTGLPSVRRWPELMPHAAQIAQLGRQFALQGQGVHAREAQPLYLRNKVALTTAERALRIQEAGAGAGA
jgi:tRNA threonylcarbamoyladenosine biosynthesis protein TsaB